MLFLLLKCLWFTTLCRRKASFSVNRSCQRTLSSLDVSWFLASSSKLKVTKWQEASLCNKVIVQMRETVREQWVPWITQPKGNSYCYCPRLLFMESRNRRSWFTGEEKVLFSVLIDKRELCNPFFLAQALSQDTCDFTPMLSIVRRV